LLIPDRILKALMAMNLPNDTQVYTARLNELLEA
jgi:hypothetical protein